VPSVFPVEVWWAVAVSGADRGRRVSGATSITSLPEYMRGKSRSKTDAVKTVPREWTENEIEWCQSRRDEGWSYSDIAKATDRSETSVQIKLKRLSKLNDSYNTKHRNAKYAANAAFALHVSPKSVLDVYAGESWWSSAGYNCVTNDKDLKFDTDYHEDAFRLLARLYVEGKRYSVIDLDPYGSAYECFDYAARMAQEGLVVSFGEWGHRRWKRLDYVRHRYRIETMSDFRVESLVSEVQRICAMHKKIATVYSAVQYGEFLRVYFTLQVFKETSQWERDTDDNQSKLFWLIRRVLHLLVAFVWWFWPRMVLRKWDYYCGQGWDVTGSTSRRKGNRAEVEVAAALQRAGWQAVTSRAANGTQGGADLITDFPMVVEVKNVARTDLAGWWRQAVEQAGDDLPVVIHKRVGHARAENWWVCMDLHTLLALVERLSDERE